MKPADLVVLACLSGLLCFSCMSDESGPPEGAEADAALAPVASDSTLREARLGTAEQEDIVGAIFGALGGMLIGLACGPAAGVCSSVFGVIGGAIGSAAPAERPPWPGGPAPRNPSYEWRSAPRETSRIRTRTR